MGFLIFWISKNQNMHAESFYLFFKKSWSLLNMSNQFDIFWNYTLFQLFLLPDFFQTFLLFFLNSEFNFLSIQLDRFSLRFFFDFIWITEKKAILIAALPLLCSRNTDRIKDNDVWIVPVCPSVRLVSVIVCWKGVILIFWDTDTGCKIRKTVFEMLRF